MEVPRIFSFWFMVAAYVIHVLDESLLGGSFVEEVQQHSWPEYSWRKFFWFNTDYFALMITSVVLYDLLGGMAHSSACVGHREAMQWFLACLVVRAFPRVFAGAAEQHSYLDGLLLHRALPPPRGTHRATHTVARSAGLIG
jgi:hypothetical protein